MEKPVVEVIRLKGAVFTDQSCSPYEECPKECTVVGEHCWYECAPVCTTGYTCSDFE